jgi:hypothetical protein
MLFRTLVGLVVVIGLSFGSSVSTVIVIVVRQMLEGFATVTTGIKNTGRNNEAFMKLIKPVELHFSQKYGFGKFTHTRGNNV